MKRRNKNRGFTLVELIIAVAILAIAISPLVANFIQSSRMNLKGRKNLNAMNLAQDIMEGLSGYTADEINTIVTGVVAPGSTESLAGKILPISATYTGVTVDSAAGAQKLEYSINGIETISTAHNKYNAKIILDPTGAKTAKYNGKDVADISEVNQFYDAVFTMPETEVDKAINDLYLQSSITSVDKVLYDGEIIRTTKVSIKDKNAGVVGAVTPDYVVTVSRDYKVTNAFRDAKGLPSSMLYNVTDENISRMPGETFPRSVYIYFEGMKNASYNATECRENIIVENTTGKDIVVHLIRTQEVDSAGNLVNPGDVAYGQMFGCKVDIISTDPTGTSDTENVHIVSNLRYDLNATDASGKPAPKYNFRVKDEGNVNYLLDTAIAFPVKDDGSLAAKTETKYDNRRAQYTYNSIALSSRPETFYQDYFTDGYQKKNKNTVYEVTIELYEAGTTNKIATYDGGVSN